MRRQWSILFLLVAALECGASEADAAVTLAMRNAGPGLSHVRVLHRAHVDSELHVVVASGASKDWQLSEDEGVWWTANSSLGIFLQRSGEPALLYTIAIANDDGDDNCYPRVERATATDVVVSCAAEKGGYTRTRKFVYDIRAKALVERVDPSLFASHRILVSGESAFRVLKGSAAEHWAARRSTRLDRTVARFGPLPQSSYAAFAKARPERVANGYSRDATEMNETIGPWQMFDGSFWFAKTFYDGEGLTGVGGFGYFDAEARRYRIYDVAGIADWSVTAMLVERDAVWLGLAHHGEWAAAAVACCDSIERLERRTG